MGAKKKTKKKAASKAAFYVSVHSMTIRKNKKNKTDDPPILVRKGKNGKSEATRLTAILDHNGLIVGYVVYAPHKPLKCGAVCYVELLHKPMVIPTEKTETIIAGCSV